MRLTTKELWAARHEITAHSGGAIQQPRRGFVRQIVDQARLRRGAEVGQGFSSFLFQELLKTYLPVHSDWSVIEIGSAPGGNLVALHRDFGYQPYGVEYSHTGVLLTRETLQKHGLNPAGVIEADFFDQRFQDGHQAQFDVVFSQGFIEHFDPPDDVVRLHINLLKPGGYLVCSIPNLRGICYPFLWVCAREHLKVHNCSIMRKRAFGRVFEPFRLDVKYCGYVGTTDLHASPFCHEHSLRGLLARALDRLQDLQDHCLFLFWRSSLPGFRLSSSLAFIGQRLS